jgi:hypothetical protein
MGLPRDWLDSWWRTDEQRKLRGDGPAFYPEGNGNSFNGKDNRQRMRCHLWRIRMNRDADRTGTRTARQLAIAVCMQRFQPSKCQD